MSHPIRVLHVFGKMDRGGAELRTLAVANRIDPNECHFDYCALSGESGVLDDEIRHSGSTVHLCRLDASFPVRFSRLLKTHKYDVVHSHVHHFSGPILMLAASCRVPVRIAHYRSTGDGVASSLPRRVQRQTTRQLVDRFATSIAAVSEAAMQSAWSVNWQDDPRCQIIHNGIETSPYHNPRLREDTRKSLGIPPKTHMVIHVGRFDHDKNQTRVVDIFHKLTENEPDSRLILVGKGKAEWESRVTQKVQYLSLAQQVQMIGLRDDIPDLLSAADLLIFPSHREGLPGVVLEACAAGIPTLGSKIGPIEEIARELGLVTPLSLDEPDSVWAHQAVRLLAQPQKCHELAIDELERSSFSLSSAVSAHRKLWRVV